MNRRGDETESRTGWLPAILAVLVLVALVILGARFGLIEKLQTLRQGFNQTIDPNTGGEALIAYNLEDGKLYYYSGSSFVAFGAGAATIFGKTFDPATLTQAFRDYLHQPRGEAVTDRTSLPLAVDQFYKTGALTRTKESSFVNSLPTLAPVIVAFRDAGNPSYRDRPTCALNKGYEFVAGVFGHPDYVLNDNRLPSSELYTQFLPASSKLSASSGYFYLTPSNEIYLCLLIDSGDRLVPISERVDSSLSSMIILRDLAIAWRDSIFVGGSSPQNITLSYTDTKTKQSLSQTVPVEKKDLYIFARVR